MANEEKQMEQKGRADLEDLTNEEEQMAGFEIGDRVDAQDPQGEWIPATFAQIRERKNAQGFTEWEGFIDYEGWDDKYLKTKSEFLFF